MNHRLSILTLAVTSLSAVLLGACSSSDQTVTPSAAAVADAGDDLVAANLARFDQLDFDAYSKQDWALFEQLHCPNVVVTNPDGTQTNGIADHEAAVKQIFAWAPTNNILEHPTKVGQGDFTAVVGRWQGTFSAPLPLPDGGAIPPTGKSFDVHLATFAHWQNGCIDQEQLFSNTQTILQEVGLAQ